MKIHLTEGKLRNIVRDSVRRVLNEIGDFYEKELELPKGAGRYALASIARDKAKRQGRSRQAAELAKYAREDFWNRFGSEDDYMEFGLTQDNDDSFRQYPYSYRKNPFDYLGRGGKVTAGSTPEEMDLIRRDTKSLKAGPRKRALQGLDVYDKVNRYIDKD